MQIVTVNIPESYIEAMKDLLDNRDFSGGLYPSKSELIRVAVRDFLIKELKKTNHSLLGTLEEKEEKEKNQDPNFIMVPIMKEKENGEHIIEFKEYKVLKRLESPNKDEPSKNIKLDSPKGKEKKEPLHNIYWEDNGFYKVSIIDPDIAHIEGFGQVRRINEYQPFIK